MILSFLDTNILVMHLRQVDNFSKKATNILKRIEEGELKVFTSNIVIFETVFLLQRRFRISKKQIAEILLPIINLPGIVLPGKKLYTKVFKLYLSTSIGFADCYHVALMEKLKITEIYSFDSDFDKIKSIKRKEL